MSGVNILSIWQEDQLKNKVFASLIKWGGAEQSRSLYQLNSFANWVGAKSKKLSSKNADRAC